MTPTCRRCGYQGKALEPSLVPGEFLCESLKACDRRKEARAKDTNYGGWGSTPNWPRKAQAVSPKQEE